MAADGSGAGGRARRAGGRRPRRRPRVRGGRQRQLRRDERAGRGRRAVRRRPARGRCRDDGGRVRPDQRSSRRAERAPGLWTDQRDDRHRGGGEEPDAAAGAGGRRRRLCRRLELPHRPGRPGAQCRRRSRAGAQPGFRAGRRRPGLPDGRHTAVARWCSTCRSTSRRPRSPTPAGSSPCRRPPGRRRTPASPMPWPTLLGQRRAAGVPGRARGAAVRTGDRCPGRPGRRAADHLRRRGRHVRGRGVRPGDLWRVRHPAGRRAGRRRGPGGGLGLQPDQVDHPARTPPRARRRCWCRSTTIPPPSAPVSRSISACWATSV